MKILFEPARIKQMVLPNRFVRSATYDGMAGPDGHVSDPQVRLISDLAAGGIGLIIHAITYVHSSGQVSGFMNSLAEDACINGMRDLTAAAHRRGAKIAIQLFHGGREARFVKTKNQLPMAPSVIEADPYYRGSCREMNGDDILSVIAAFGDAAGRAKDAGFDAVQIHGAHGYLFSQFLSPFTNRRSDAWGGTLENRLRLHREVCLAMRKQVGEDYPILIKLGVEDGFPDGLEFSEGLRAARMLAESGFDSLEISSGVRGKKYEGTEYRTKINQTREGYFRDWAGRVRQQVDKPVMAVGGFRTMKMMETLVRENDADFVSLCRPLIAEPDLIRRWEKNPDIRPVCVSCNLCLELLHKGGALHCVMLRKRAKKTSAR